MDVDTLAKEIGVGRTTLWRWGKAGLIPQPERIGRRSLYTRSAVAMARTIAQVSR